MQSAFLVEHSNVGERRPVYVVRDGETVDELMHRICVTEAEQGHQVFLLGTLRLRPVMLYGPVMT